MKVKPEPSPEQPPFVEVIRVSTQAQADRDTPEEQRAEADRYRAAHPGTFVERIDEAVSGAKDAASRSDIQRLFELLAAGNVRQVRVRHVDRLTRHDDPLGSASSSTVRSATRGR